MVDGEMAERGVSGGKEVGAWVAGCVTSVSAGTKDGRNEEQAAGGVTNHAALIQSWVKNMNKWIALFDENYAKKKGKNICFS